MGSTDMEEQLITERVLADESQSNVAPSHVTGTVIFSTCVAVLGSFNNGYAAAFTSSAEAGIMKDLGLSLAEYSVFGSISSIGSMIGALFSGKLADFIGRRATMWLIELFCILGWLSIVFAKAAWLLDLGKFSLGIGIGLQCFVAPVYIGEIAPKNIRGACTFANELMATFAMSLMYFVGNLIAWRMLAIIGVVPCVLQVLGVFFIPESPRWLAFVGQQKRSVSALQLLRGVNANVSQEADQIRESMEASKHHSNLNFLELFDRKYTPALMLAVGSTILVQFGGAYAIGSYASSIFEAAGCSAKVGSTALSINQLVFAIVGVLLTDKWGRRPLWLISAAGTCLGNILIALAFLLKDFHESQTISAALVLPGILIFSATFTTGMSGSQWIILSEILPVNIKALAGSLITLFNWFLSWVTTFTFNFVFQWSSTGVFFIFSGVCASTFVFVAKILPETKGRTLEEIELLFSN